MGKELAIECYSYFALDCKQFCSLLRGFSSKRETDLFLLMTTDFPAITAFSLFPLIFIRKRLNASAIKDLRCEWYLKIFSKLHVPLVARA